MIYKMADNPIWKKQRMLGFIHINKIFFRKWKISKRSPDNSQD